MVLWSTMPSLSLLLSFPASVFLAQSCTRNAKRSVSQVRAALLALKLRVIAGERPERFGVSGSHAAKQHPLTIADVDTDITDAAKHH